jgi:hypothetical protein
MPGRFLNDEVKMRFIVLFILVVLTATSLLTPGAALGANGDGGVVARFSHGGMILRMTSDLEFEELWGLVINYCDGSREEIWHRFPSKIEYRATLGAAGYNFYAEKPMKRVLIKTLPIEATGGQVINFRLTMVRHKCDKVELVVQDDFGEQAKCRVGKVTVVP